jgi:altronate dehydratase
MAFTFDFADMQAFMKSMKIPPRDAYDLPTSSKRFDDMDINAGTILDRTETVDEVGQRIFEDTIAVAGKKTVRAEESGFHTEFKVWESLWPAI